MPRTLARNLIVFVGLVALAVASRVMPHAPNVAAVGAVALFAGWFFRSRAAAVATPVAAMVISDAVIGGYTLGIMVAVYASFIAPVFFGRLIGRGRSVSRTLGGAGAGSLAASMLFFVTTNFAVWAFGGLYAHTAAGLGACYGAALPFFRFTAAGDLVFTAILFGGYLLGVRLLALRRPGAVELAPAGAPWTGISA